MYEDISAAEVDQRIAASHPSLQQVVAYWRSKASGRPMPLRAAIDPVELKPYLPSIMLVDVVPDDRRFVYRLVGTHEVAGRGRDPTGQAVRDAFYGASMEECLAAYEYVARERRPFCIRDPYVTPDGWEEREDTIYLPLSHDGENVGVILVYSYSHVFKARTGLTLVMQ
jgi:hypothetical protein